MQPDTLRVFIAIELPEAVRAGLAPLQAQLRATGLPLRLVRPEGIHLTLAFLGDIPTGRGALWAPALQAAVAQGTQGIAPFRLRAEGLGMFPHARRPRVIWVGVQGEATAQAALAALARQTIAALHAAGFPCDSRFDPHLTLARVAERAPPAQVTAIGTAVQALPSFAPLPFAVDQVSVMRSELRPGGAVYTRLAVVALAQ